jgi:hypothetical protein
MPQIATKHSPALSHHVDQALAWLDACAEGENTPALSYAALELRYAIERIAIHYWYALLDRPVTDDDLRDVASFKALEGRIYELAGHQRQIDAHFEFMRVFLSELKIEAPLDAPKIGRLSAAWHDCSEVCHVGWPMSSAVEGVAAATLTRLRQVLGMLQEYVASLGWPVLNDPSIVELRDKFVLGHATAEEVRKHMRKIGVWAKVEYLDGRPSEFIGEVVPPEEQEAGS